MLSGCEENVHFIVLVAKYFINKIMYFVIFICFIWIIFVNNVIFDIHVVYIVFLYTEMLVRLIFSHRL